MRALLSSSGSYEPCRHKAGALVPHIGNFTWIPLEVAPSVSDMTKVAVVQAAPVGFNPEATLQKAEELVGNAARAGARLVVLPEAFVGGYPKGSSFGAVVGDRTEEGYGEFGRYAAGASEIPGPVSQRLGEIAGTSNVYLVSGVIEKAGGTLYSSIAFFDDDGSLLGVRRKLMPTGAERLVWGFADGSSIEAYPTPMGRLGAVICWENYMPLLRAAMYSKGIELYIAPTADGRDRWLATMRHIALEGRCYVLSANYFARRKDFPPGHPCPHGSSDETVVSRGGSCIIDPFGEIVAGPAYDEEALLFADIDLEKVATSKYDFDPIGHYGRPDLFQLHVDTAPRDAVVFSRQPAE